MVLHCLRGLLLGLGFSGVMSRLRVYPGRIYAGFAIGPSHLRAWGFYTFGETLALLSFVPSGLFLVLPGGLLKGFPYAFLLMFSFVQGFLSYLLLVFHCCTHGFSGG